MKHRNYKVTCVPETISVDEAASLLGISRATAFRATKTGELPVIRFGRRLVVPVAALDRLLTEGMPSKRTA